VEHGERAQRHGPRQPLELTPARQHRRAERGARAEHTDRPRRRAEVGAQRDVQRESERRQQCQCARCARHHVFGVVARTTPTAEREHERECAEDHEQRQVVLRVEVARDEDHVQDE
jgi:hypothetical protein